ncbi:MAG: hypothetical protein N2246_06090 [Candidatus Sumerlaeia bacterium]|nr:hypothetical protein [Candidatus Sumerlaeia bacterium]
MSVKDSKKSKIILANLKQAFAVKDEAGFSKEETAFMEKVADFICRRGLEAPVIMGLATMKPLNFIGSQLLIFLQPFLSPFFNETDYQRLIDILGRRDGIECFIQILERKTEAKKQSLKK